MIIKDRTLWVMCSRIVGSGEGMVRKPHMNAQIFLHALTRQYQLERIQVIEAVSPVLDCQRCKVRFVQTASLRDKIHERAF